MRVEVFAPAKINLTLHVTGRRPDGYHELDSLVVFADVGDTVSASPADGLSLEIDGPRAGGLEVEGNLVLRAARAFGGGQGAALRLTKRLPVASGIGGGSADAAAALTALSRLWSCPLPPAEAILALGADVPVCLAGRPCRMQGIGETLSSVPAIPMFDILLVNPGVSVSTPEVFRRLDTPDNAPMDLPERWGDAVGFCAWLAARRNDLLRPALALAPVIGEVLGRLRGEGALFAGMSGSGATCFGLFPPDGHSAKRGLASVVADRPDWWCANGTVLRDRYEMRATT